MKFDWYYRDHARCCYPLPAASLLEKIVPVRHSALLADSRPSFPAEAFDTGCSSHHPMGSSSSTPALLRKMTTLGCVKICMDLIKDV